jgi:hypothetical protein
MMDNIRPDPAVELDQLPDGLQFMEWVEALP